MNILGVIGSYRKDGNTDVLVRKALAGAERHGIETGCLFLPDYQIRDCNGCEGCRTSLRCIVKDDMQTIYPRLEAADALVIGSPTYFYNVTGIMKNFLDRLYCYDIFDETDRSVWISKNECSAIKYALTVSVCEQEAEEDMGYTSLTMSRSLEAVGYRVVENLKVLQLYAKGDAAKQKDPLHRAFAAGEKLAKTLLLREQIKNKA